MGVQPEIEEPLHEREGQVSEANSTKFAPTFHLT